MPLAELAQRLSELPRDVEIVAYCRGPFCLMSDEAVAMLREARIPCAQDLRWRQRMAGRGTAGDPAMNPR
jgi:rhodanese-related sulfurtransferase